MDQPKTNFCPYCGADRTSTGIYCLQCGKELPLLDEEKILIKKFGTDKKPSMLESLKGMFSNPAKTLERIYYSEDEWQPAFIWVVIYGILMGFALFLIMTKTNFIIFGSDPTLVDYMIQNIFYFKIYLALFEGFIAIMEWLIYVGMFYLVLILLRKHFKLRKVIIIAEYASIALIFIGILNILTAVLVPPITSTLNLDGFSFDFGYKLNEILTSNILFIIFNYAEYPIVLIFCFLIGIGLYQEENFEKIDAVIVVLITFITLDIAIPSILQFSGFII
ncbi:MAG: zinc ribbon domain-containing protein [Candidatus Lokiarchaeota archaeon]|nr:zinc ribbon domain-containing protein [Candidatus Lokiarchaeota archaeon]